MTGVPSGVVGQTAGVVGPGAPDLAAHHLARHGYVTLRGLFDDDSLVAAQEELVAAQGAVAAGTLGGRHATDVLDDPASRIDGRPFSHYVCFATEVSPAARALSEHADLVATVHRILGEHAWLLDDGQFGVVYQDARPGPASGYSRIGWHTDHQSAPHLDIWPAVAFTVHFDPTSPANGFLRVVPDSHTRTTAGLPPGFERVPGEIALYQERGDVLLHHADLWHAAARATADGPDAVRRHLRGSWHTGMRLPAGYGTDDFVKNARR